MIVILYAIHNIVSKINKNQKNVLYFYEIKLSHPKLCNIRIFLYEYLYEYFYMNINQLLILQNSNNIDKIFKK